MKQIQFRVFIFLLAGATLYAACRKTDSAYREDSKATETTEEQFFKKYASNDPDIKAMAAFIENKNNKNPFIERVVKKIGLPRWDKAVRKSISGTKGRSASDSSEITYIPFVRESQNYVNASLAIRTSGADTSFTYLCDWQYRQRPFNPVSDTSAEAMALFFMQMDRNVFGHTEFMITDTLLFSNHPTENGTALKKIQLLNSPSAAGRNSVVILEVCQVYAICGSVDYCNAHGGCDYMDCVSDPDVCGMFEICWEYIPGGGSGGGGGGGGTGGTGGNGGSGGGGGGDDDIPPDCGTASFAGSGSTSDLIPCDPGWMPGGGGPPPANQTIIDSLQGYPCAQSVLASIASINTTTKNILATVFNLNQNVNIVFVADSTLPSNTNGYTPGSEISYVNGVFTAHVHMPPYILKNASREFIAKTMYHEAIHAYLNYMWLKFKNHEIDSITFRTLYPKIFAFKNQGEAQHDQMAATYVNNIKDIVLAFNPAISDSVNRAISWGGLTTTNAWKNLGSDTFQLNRLRSISRDSSITKMQSLNLKKCK